jgi:hypothetical protein
MAACACAANLASIVTISSLFCPPAGTVDFLDGYGKVHDDTVVQPAIGGDAISFFAFFFSPRAPSLVVDVWRIFDIQYRILLNVKGLYNTYWHVDRLLLISLEMVVGCQLCTAFTVSEGGRSGLCLAPDGFWRHP